MHEEVGRRGEAISSLVSGGCIVSGAFLRQSLLFTGVHAHSFSRVEKAVILPDADIGRGARLRNVIVEKGVHIPAGPCGGRGRGRGRPTVPPHRTRDLPDHAAHDRSPGQLTLTRVLAVASEIFPLVKTGGLGDVTGALPPALAAAGAETTTVVPGLSDGH